jgi:hypothetical protein
VASVFAVVSKKVFETQARVSGKVLGLGAVWVTSKYASTHAALQPLAGGGHLFLVTVRPPDEALWLIALLRDVKAAKDGWSSSPNATPITDITSLKSKIRFATGTGITAAKGKLGMSLQTPRALTDADVKLLLAVAAPGAAPPAAATAPAGQKTYHLNMHETGPLPCLCARCLAKAGERVVVDGSAAGGTSQTPSDGEAFVRREARAKDRVLYYWLSETLAPSEKAVRFAVEQRMRQKLPAAIVHAAGKARSHDDEEDDE